MKILKVKSFLYSTLLFNLSFQSSLAFSSQMQIANKPLFTTVNEPPLVMLIMGRDHKLYYEAYNDASDLNGDGDLDITYKPDEIDYFGYFNSYICYKYDQPNERFNPSSETNNKTCGGAEEWSGDFLNYLTTSRIDAMRKVLYGGYRDVDVLNNTVLERSYIPQDAHSWGKEYRGKNSSGYDISLYSPLSEPATGKNHLFANTSLLKTYDNNHGSVRGTLMQQKHPNDYTKGKPYAITMPLLRVIPSVKNRVWEWVSIESPVAANKLCSLNSNSGCKEIEKSDKVTFPEITKDTTPNIYDFAVRVKVCDKEFSTANTFKESCQIYKNDDYKPVGLLQKYGSTGGMKFGLLTGSYDKNTSGGRLRKPISNFNEISSLTGKVINHNGIIGNINKLKIYGFGQGNSYGYNSTTATCSGNNLFNETNLDNGRCSDWGNPIAEMMLESLRYFSGKGVSTDEFSSTTTIDDAIGLSKATQQQWLNPYLRANVEQCAKPFQLVISDINPSHDSDQLPGSSASWTKKAYDGGNIGSGDNQLNVSSLSQTIWTGEGLGTSDIFIGQVGATKDGAPSAKQASSFANIRGLAPEDPNRKGSYYSAAIAYYGKKIGLIDNESTTQKLSTLAVALASPLPKIQIPQNNPRVVIVPFAKTVGNKQEHTYGSKKPTNQIVDFYVESISDYEGTFRINFEDVEQGSDHDMDAIVKYHYKLDGNKLHITLTSEYAAGSARQHIGYIISGTSQDGIYLEVKDKDSQDPTNPNEIAKYEAVPASEYKFNTPPGRWYSDPAVTDKNIYLPWTTTRTFTIDSSISVAKQLENPLWYAAKWGFYDDIDGSQTPNTSVEWAKENSSDPKGYFLVTNAGDLTTQLSNAFNLITTAGGSSSSAAASSGSLQTDTLVFQAGFKTEGWVGTFDAYSFDDEGELKKEWSFHDVLNTQTTRQIITYNPARNRGTPFRWSATNLSQAQRGVISSADCNNSNMTLENCENSINYWGNQYINYLRGSSIDYPSIRKRKSKLGDIVNSNPLYIGQPRHVYPLKWKDKLYPNKSMPENNNRFSSFAKQYKSRKPLVTFGANDGMLHIIQATAKSKNSDNTDNEGGGNGVIPSTDGSESNSNQQPGTGVGVEAASNGKELLAYVPSMVYENLRSLTDKEYDNLNSTSNDKGHKYFVDGSPVSADAYIDSKWRTVLVGTLGAGGKGVFALDITNPTSFNENKANELVLWEFKDHDTSGNSLRPNGDEDLGYTFGEASIVRLHNGKWAAIFGNGYNSVNGKAVLYIVNLHTGKLIKKIDTEVGPITRNIVNNNSTIGTKTFYNGLSSPRPVDYDGDAITDYIFAGDLQGNMWAFDLTSENKSQWNIVSYGGVKKPFFSVPEELVSIGGDEDNPHKVNIPKAITVKPTVGFIKNSRDPRDLMVYFGTGKYFEANDKYADNQPTQHFYGLYFKGKNPTRILSHLKLVEQTITAEVNQPFRDNANIAGIRKTSNSTICLTGICDSGDDEGWYIPLKFGNINKGERQVSDPIIRGEKIIFTTMIPSQNACETGGSGWLMELNRFSGSRLSKSPIDYNNDGKIDERDNYINEPITGTKVGPGFIPRPAIVLEGNGFEKKFLNTSSNELKVISESNSFGSSGRLNWKELKKQ